MKKQIENIGLQQGRDLLRISENTYQKGARSLGSNDLIFVSYCRSEQLLLKLSF